MTTNTQLNKFNNTSFPQFHGFRAALTAVVALALIVSLIIWAGLPESPEQRLAIGVGAAVMVGITFAFVAIGWHLLVRPLPKGQIVPQTHVSTKVRELIATLITLTSLNLIVGGMWDEVWHRQFGTPLGEDFFWRPHLLMYSFFLLIIIYAFAGLWYLMKSGRGTLQQRFRANPVIGLMVVVSGFMLFAVPADPLWHMIYGEDLSAWSLPHIVLGISWIGVLLLAPAILLTTMPLREWASLRRIGIKDVLALITFASMLNFLLQLMTTEWYATTFRADSILLQRPEWLLTAIIVILGAFIGNLANTTLRRWGAATVVGLMALLLRVTLQMLFENNGNLSPSTWMLTLAPMIALDLTYFVSLRFTRTPPNSMIAGTAAAFGILPVLPLVNTWFIYPEISTVNLFGVIVSAVIGGMGACWFGELLGSTMATRNKQIDAEANETRTLQWAAPTALLATLAFIVFFVTTAAPPM